MRCGRSLQCIGEQGTKVARKCIWKYGRAFDQTSITETGRSTRVITIDQGYSVAVLLQLERERSADDAGANHNHIATLRCLH
jgi:hypothetical protein